MLQSTIKKTRKATVKKKLLQFAFIVFVASTLSFDTPPETISPYASGAPVTVDLRDDDMVKLFMTTASDSVLTILNGNLWMLPAGFADDKEERIDLFVAYARALMPHVITLQEIWTKNQVRYLKKRFPDYQVFASGRRGPFNRGGLVTMTRVPSDSAGFSRFEIERGASRLERKARKGYLTVRISTPGFKTCIVNTHLYAPTKEKEQTFARAQFETLKNLDLKGDYFIVGDLNLPQKPFERLNDSFFMTERDTMHTVDPINKYRIRKDKKTKSYKVDRFLMPQAYADRFALHSMLIREPVVSDHYMLAYRIEHQPVLPHIAASVAE